MGRLFSGQSEERPNDPDRLPARGLSEELLGNSYEQLREIWLEMNHITDGLELKIHRHRFRAFPDCVSGVEVMPACLSVCLCLFLFVPLSCCLSFSCLSV